MHAFSESAAPAPAVPPLGGDLPVEAPLSPVRRALVVLGIAATLFLAYIFCALSLLAVVALLLADIALVIPALRFGMAGYFAGSIMKQGVLAKLLFQALRLEDNPELTVPLERHDAPALFTMLEDLAARIGVPPPAEVRLMMPMNAWVKVQGYRAGRKGSVVGIGFDLMAACTVDQLRSILAHELAHAKLIQPGFNGWLTNAMRRVAQLAASVGAVDEAARAQRTTFYTASLIFKGLDAYGRAGSKLIALHSRQHEFAADALAAQVAGAAAFRDGLLRVHVVEQSLADLDHRERLIQSEREASFTSWLQAKMIVAPDAEPGLIEQALAGRKRDALDSHPALADRLRALPSPEAPAPDSPSAVHLLADPDHTVSRLLGEIERLINEAEKKENRSLLEEARKNTPKPAITALQWLLLAVLLVLAALLLVVVTGMFSDMSSGNQSDESTGVMRVALFAIGVLVACMAGGMRLYPRAGRREGALLPSPVYAALASQLDQGPICQNAQAAAVWRASALADYPAVLPPDVIGRRAQAAWWGRRCFEALALADYRQAFACASHCLALRPLHFEALVAMPVIAAAVGSEEEAKVALERLFRRYPLGASVSWSAAWCAAFLGDWAPAEAYLHDAAARRPDDATVRALLGYCQWQREKIRESVSNLRRAIQLCPGDRALQLLLARVLLDGGRLREGQQLLGSLDAQTAGTEEALVVRTRAHLLLGQVEQAERSAEELTSRYPTARAWLELGRAYHEAHQLERAGQAYRRAGEYGHYPEALIGEALVLRDRGDVVQAQARLLASLDTTRPMVPEAAHPHRLLGPVCRMLSTFHEPVSCRAWMARLNVQGLGFDAPGLVLIVLAESNEAASGVLLEIWGALHGGAAAPPPMVIWQMLPNDNQPEAPVQPGIYSVQLTQAVGLPPVGG